MLFLTTEIHIPCCLIVAHSPWTHVRKVVTTIAICLNNTPSLVLKRGRHFVHLLNRLFDLLHLGLGSGSHQPLAYKHLDVFQYPFH
jgi:hypothetical protein